MGARPGGAVVGGDGNVGCGVVGSSLGAVADGSGVGGDAAAGDTGDTEQMLRDALLDCMMLVKERPGHSAPPCLKLALMLGMR